MDKKQHEYFDFMMSKPSGGSQFSSGGNGGEGCLTTIIGVVIILLEPQLSVVLWIRYVNLNERTFMSAFFAVYTILDFACDRI